MRIQGTRHLAKGLLGPTLTLCPLATLGIDAQVLNVPVLE